MRTASVQQLPSWNGSRRTRAGSRAAERTPFTAGANDNASAVGLVLTLAEAPVSPPLAHTRVWQACTGCEEVQHYGADPFLPTASA